MSATRWAQTLFAAFAQSGVRRVVVSPGSRSTPLAFAAATTPGLEVSSVLDERSAGFFALGQARVTGEPSVLVCTSGSAAAHYFPAVVEAKYAGLPLIIVSADRPFELQHAGAAQTMDQLQLFGRFAAQFFELGTPEDDASVLTGLAHVANRAVHIALEEGGVVHLNARFRKPFEPTPETLPALHLERVTQHARSLRTLEPSELRRLARRLDAAERPMIVAGPMSIHDSPSPSTLGRLAVKWGAPVLAEAPSQVRFAALGPDVVRADHFDLYLDLPEASGEVRPDLVLEIGGTPTSRSYANFLSAHPGLERIVLCPSSAADPHGTASLVARVSLSATLSALESALRPAQRGRAWLEHFERWESRAQAVLEARPSIPTSLGEGEIAEALVRALPEGALLMVGNSLPLRHLDRYCARVGAQIPVLSQRGLNGIDGLVSGASGSASAARRPLALILGDVSFLHDLGGLSIARQLATPLVIVAIHNDGGRIFEELPVARNSLVAPHKNLWTTSHGLKFGGVAESFQIRHERVATRASLETALDDAFSHAGASLIEAQVPPDEAERTWRWVRASLDRRSPS